MPEILAGRHAIITRSVSEGRLRKCVVGRFNQDERLFVIHPSLTLRVMMTLRPAEPARELLV